MTSSGLSQLGLGDDKFTERLCYKLGLWNFKDVGAQQAGRAGML